MFFSVNVTFCLFCALAYNRNLEADQHKCYKNWTNTLTVMEAHKCLSNWKEPRDEWSDGDRESTVYTRILETRSYGKLLMVRNKVLSKYVKVRANEVLNYAVKQR